MQPNIEILNASNAAAGKTITARESSVQYVRTKVQYSPAQSDAASWAWPMGAWANPTSSLKNSLAFAACVRPAQISPQDSRRPDDCQYLYPLMP